MLRCIEIAKNGRAISAPNPSVGCVIVHNDFIIGEGFTSTFGGNHAEVNAINSVKNKKLLNKSTLYVTLEPCSHYGKTPPCTDLILKYNIPTVIIGTKDSNPEVGGKGIKVLEENGCKVQFGILENECRQLHKRFLTFHEKSRPYIILKWAESKDGYIAPLEKNEAKPVWISNPYSRQISHKWRSEEQAILVGTNTVLDDNPSLTTRDWFGKNPIRVVLDRKGKLSPDHSVFNGDSTTFIIGSKDYTSQSSILEGIIFKAIDWEAKELIAKQCCSILYNANITSLIVEGGSRTLNTFIKEGLWDEARIFKSSNKLINGIKAPSINISPKKEIFLVNDKLSYYFNNQ